MHVMAALNDYTHAVEQARGKLAASRIDDILRDHLQRHLPKVDYAFAQPQAKSEARAQANLVRLVRDQLGKEHGNYVRSFIMACENLIPTLENAS